MKKALLIIDHGSKLKAANDMIFDVVETIKKSNSDLIVVGCHMEIAPPTIEDGFKACVEAGAEIVIAQPFMLSPGRHSTSDIPELVKEAAKQYPNIEYEIRPHFGQHYKIAEIITESI